MKIVAVGALQNENLFKQYYNSDCLCTFSKDIADVCLLHESLSAALILLKRFRVTELTNLQSSVNAQGGVVMSVIGWNWKE